MEKTAGLRLRTRAFMRRKNIEITPKRYLQEALSAMALGLFSSLLIGLILKTAGGQYILHMGQSAVADFLVNTGDLAMKMMGASVGVAVAWALKAPPLVIFTGAVIGMAGAGPGGPAGAFLAVAVGTEFGKAVSKETSVDIIVTPAVSLLTGGAAAIIFSPLIGKLMSGLGSIITEATEWKPLFFGIAIAVIVGLALTAPISSAALCIMLDLSGLAAGAATAGCCAQMVGFAAISFRENGFGGLVAQGLGTSMIQLPNIFKNPWILLPPTLAGAVAGPLSTVVFKMTNNAMGAGMGTSGLVGQIGTFATMGFSLTVVVKVIMVQFLVPIAVSLATDRLLRKAGKTCSQDYKLETDY